MSSGSEDETVKIWDASSNTCFQTVKLRKALDSLSFDSPGAFVRNAIGTSTFQDLETSSTGDIAEPEHSLYLPSGLRDIAYGFNMLRRIRLEHYQTRALKKSDSTA